MRWIGGIAAMLAATGSGAAGPSNYRYGNQRPNVIQAPGTPAPAPEGFGDGGKPRLIVSTDIGNEPDDSESIVRLLTYANDIDIEGMIASTSASLPLETHPELLRERIAAYGAVLPNLRRHAPGYPDAAALQAIVRDGSHVYGMSGVGPGRDTPGSRQIVAAADRKDARPLWITIWGGAADLAQALTTVRATRSPAELASFVARLRVHAISDQDDAGPWIRQEFPQLFWIGSIHAFRDYSVAGWTGFARDAVIGNPALDPGQVDHRWQEGIQHLGPLGALYPLSTGLMEGDTPSFLGLIPNGLDVPERPDYGGWGGRHAQVSPAYGLRADAADAVAGRDGVVRRDAMASLWRWREAVQNDFLARMQWTVTPDRTAANHPPRVVVNGDRDDRPLLLHVRPGQPVRLSAAGSADPDGGPLRYRWFQYKEPTFILRSTKTLAIAGQDTAEASVTAPDPDVNAPRDYHVVLEVTDTGSPPLTRYRRVVLAVDH